MSRIAHSPSIVVLGAVFAMVLLARATPVLLSQTPAPGGRAASAPTAAQIAPFVGDWIVTVTVMANDATFALSVKTDGATPSATIRSDGQPTVNVSDITMSGNSLVLKYMTEAMGASMSTVLALTPDGAGLRASMAVMDGQYEMSGTAAKQAPGTTIRATGFGGGGGRGAATSDLTDFTPKTPYRPRTPAEEAEGFMLPTGYRMELIAAEPDVINPTVIEFDGDGRMYVAEMISYMMDASASREHDPISRISRWESSRGDGRYDKHTVFADHLAAPRMILPLQDGVILTSETDSDDIIKLTDANGDGVADRREVVFTGIGQSGDANIEHQKAGLLWNMDNWIYTTYNAFRIRWTPSGFLREPTGPNGGQWGLASDDDGKPWFVDAGGERGPMNFQYPIHYGAFTPCALAGRGARAGAAGPPPAANPNCPPGMENGFEKDFAVVWPGPGIGDMQGGIGRTRMPAQNLNHFTATTGPAIVRGDRLPADLKGHLLFAEPVGRLIRRAAIDNIEGLTQLRNVYPNAEFLTSIDQLFRPVSISNAPDGTVYIADMYHGIIQEREWSGPGSYLRAKIEQYQLDKVASHGRIWRLRYDGRAAVPATDTNIGQAAIPAIEPAFAPPKMYSETAAQLVSHFTHPNGWWRDTAQRLLILKQDKTVVPALQQLVSSSRPGSRAVASANLAEGEGGRPSDNRLARFHALWTLEGLNALEASLVREVMKDRSPRMRVQAIRASETLYKAGDKSFANDYRALTRDADPNVAIQAMLTTNLFKLPDAADVIKAAQSASQAKGVALVGERLLAPAPTFGGGRRGPLSPEEEKRLQQGSEVFGAVCFACHGADAMGKAVEGAAPGTMMGPPLAGSPRVQAHRDYIVKVLLHGLSGPLAGKIYPDVMAPLGSTSSDDWVAGVASYVRSSFGNSAGMVTPADVARVRKDTATRKTPWTYPELDASLPRPLDEQQWKLTASHGTEAAAAATSLRGWSSGAPQAAGMWLGVELAQPAVVTELQFDSNASSGRGGRGGSGSAPVIGYPRGYTVQVSTDGTSWSDPVASGRGEGPHTTITFAPTRARFVRVTLTDPGADAPPWSVRNLRLYEAPSSTAGK